MIHIYVADAEEIQDPLEHGMLLDGLPKLRKEKIERYKYAKDRRESAAAGILLNKVLERHHSLGKEILVNENGKPNVEGIYFNLSHSHGKLICAVDEEAEIGCDIEKKQKARMMVAKKICTPGELEILSKAEEQEQNKLFVRIWTMKEAYVKMTGEGIRFPLKEVEIKFGKQIEIYRNGIKENCYIKEYELGDFQISVCAKNEEFAEIENIEI